MCGLFKQIDKLYLKVQIVVSVFVETYTSNTEFIDSKQFLNLTRINYKPKFLINLPDL